MNRWFPHRRVVASALNRAALLAALLALSTAWMALFAQNARAQSAASQNGVRPFPATAKRGVMEVRMTPVVLIDGTAERLSPGARIRGVNNMLMLTGQLVGQRLVVNYTRDAQGMIHEVWLLNALEAERELPSTPATSSWSYSPAVPKSP